jgi:hypothetical protein
LIVPVQATQELLRNNHYLGPCRRGMFAWVDDHGCIVFARPAARNLPKDWLELSRWCLVGDGLGSLQWSAFLRAWRSQPQSAATTIVSYSDPRVGHTGALYRACNWLWAPTWHRLRPPPTGNGSWAGGDKVETVKDRWVFPVAQDDRRAAILLVKDDSLRRSKPWAEYREPTWKRDRFRPHTGGGDYQLFAASLRGFTGFHRGVFA